MKIIKKEDVVTGVAKPEDVEFGWRMWSCKRLSWWYHEIQLFVEFGPLNIQAASDLSDEELQRILHGDVQKIREFGSAVKALGKAALKMHSYDRFIIYCHPDEVKNLSGAKKYFEAHGVKDADADELFRAALENGAISSADKELLAK